MSKPEVNVLVGGPISGVAPCQYKTKILKANLPFKEQVEGEGNENTKFVIKWDFDIGGETVTIPENCVLKFDGGSLRNGILAGDNTAIDAAVIKIFNNINFNGSFNLSEIYPEWFGAVANSDSYDSTDAIQACINASENTYGKLVKFGQGIYYITTIYPKFKVSIVGSGIGCTILKQIEGENRQHAIFVQSYYSCFKLADFSLVGNYSVNPLNPSDDGSRGIFIESVDNSEGSKSNSGAPKIKIRGEFPNGSAYKYCKIDNIFVSNFGRGIHTSSSIYCVFLSNSYFRDCYSGGYWSASDSTINNCYFERNAYVGLQLGGSNNKVENCKIIWNSRYVSAGAALSVVSNRNQITNCETQDNYSKSLYIGGNSNVFSNFLINNDGYYFYYHESFENAYPKCFIQIGANVNGVVFDNVVITAYEAKESAPFGTVATPIVCFSSAIKDPYNGIKLMPNYGFKDNVYYDTPIFRGVYKDSHDEEITVYSKDESSPNCWIDGTVVTDIKNNVPFFSFTDENPCIHVNQEHSAKDSSLTLFISFCFTELISGFRKILYLASGNDSLWGIAAEMGIDGISRIGAHDLVGGKTTMANYVSDKNKSRLLTACVTFRNNRLFFRGYYRDLDNDLCYIYRYKDTPDEGMSDKLYDRILLCGGIWYNKIIVTREDIPDVYLIPGLNLGRFRNNSEVFISADNLIFPHRTLGNADQRPLLTSADKGFQYFDESIEPSRPIYWDGENWIDATGTIQ